MTFEYVETQEQLQHICDILSKEKSIAIDLECENNLHHYGVFISLIQISSPTTHWIVDVLKLKQIDCLINILEDTTIEIIIHDVSFDLRILAKQFNCYPQHIFDTQLAALLLGKEKVGLKNLLEEYCNIGKESKFQMADWTRRPLTKAMLEYAAKDSMYLHKVKESLLKDLTKKGRLEWVKEEMVYLNTIRFEYPTPQWHDVKCVKSTEAEVMGRIKELHAVRESIAKKVDRPVHFIFNNKQLIEFATTPPDWDTVKRVHPVVRRSAHRFKKALDQAKSVKLPKNQYKKFSQKQKEQLNALLECQKKLSLKYNIAGYLIMNKDQMRDIVISGNKKSLRTWQKELLEQTKCA